MSEQLNLFQYPKHIQEPNSAIIHQGKPRFNSAIRNQVEFVQATLDDLIPEDHQVRNILNYVEQMDLSPIYNKIKSTEGNPGRPPIDPRILFALWIYAIIEGIGSARVIDRYCFEHIAFRWLCGGVSVNYHTISDFRKNNSKEFDELISETIARLMSRDLVSLKRVSQDGMRVRASAGSSSFRRKQTLKELKAIAIEQVDLLRKEIDEDPTACLNRQMAAKKRAVSERKERVEQALGELKKETIEKGMAKKKQRKPFTQAEKDKMRVSTTDPEAKKMKMGNGGFNPAYNMQLAVDTESRFIVGNIVVNKGNDFNQMPPMINQVEDRYAKIADEWLVDQGYLVHDHISNTQKRGCKVFVTPSKVGKKNAYEPHDGEDNELAEWRVRMGTDEAKEIYKDRASNSEWANAGMRNRGMKQLLVRGINNVKSVLSLHTLTHNILRAVKLEYVW
jgi:transposase